MDIQLSQKIHLAILLSFPFIDVYPDYAGQITRSLNEASPVLSSIRPSKASQWPSMIDFLGTTTSRTPWSRERIMIIPPQSQAQ